MSKMTAPIMKLRRTSPFGNDRTSTGLKHSRIGKMLSSFALGLEKQPKHTDFSAATAALRRHPRDGTTWMCAIYEAFQDAMTGAQSVTNIAQDTPTVVPSGALHNRRKMPSLSRSAILFDSMSSIFGVFYTLLTLASLSESCVDQFGGVSLLPLSCSP